jgi:hypothetical protein
MRTVTALFLLAGITPVLSQQAGMQNAWDIHKTLAAVALLADRLAPVVDQIHPENWTGAPGGYVAQAKTCRNELSAMATESRKLDQNPEKLTDALQLLFRIRATETVLGSFSEGLRKYANPPLADMLNAAIAENAGNKDRLQQYILELAVAREQEFRVADQEAQRCRQTLSRQPSHERQPGAQEKN